MLVATMRSMRSSLHGAVMRYDAALQARPLRTKMISSGIINAAADTVVQCSDGQSSGWSMQRTAVYGIGYGAIWFAPIMHAVTTTWGRIMPATTFASLAFKTAVDMCTVIPLHLGVVIAVQATNRGEEPKQAVRDNLHEAWKNAFLVWPPVLIGIYQIPVAYRVLCMNFVSFNWNCFLIWSSQRRTAGLLESRAALAA